MAIARKSKPARKGGRPVKHGNPQAPRTAKTPLSLPPAEPEQATTSAPSLVSEETAPTPLPFPQYGEDSKLRNTAVKIVTMRSAGMGEDEIAKALGLSRSTLAGYVYKAGRNGYLTFDDPKDQLEYQVLHKVVRNLDQALDSERTLMNGMPVRTHVALKVGEGTLFKRFGEPTTSQVSAVVAIRIEMPSADGTAPAQIREGTTGGAPAFLEGVVDAVEK